MENKSLTTLCLIISIVGITTIIVTSGTFEPITQDQITKDDLDKIITIKGKINSIRETPGTYKITVNNIPTTVFKTKPLNLKKGDSIKVTGKVQEYNNKLELLADKIFTT